MQEDRIARRIRVRGSVQGVAYRAWMREHAIDLGLSGWVRNDEDGSVSALVAGPPDAVGRMVAMMRRGPAAARVEALDEEEGEMPDAAGFEIRF